tara:strand:- start:610 stop:945 length:336 start_codon:yes stop_codon:yes gene_type:complete
MNKKPKKELLGMFGVDSGQVMIGDPCYLSDWKNNEFKTEQSEMGHKQIQIKDYSYNGACQMTINEQMGGELKNKNGAVLSVVSSTGFGDGVYPVYATKKDGRVKELTIKFF